MNDQKKEERPVPAEREQAVSVTEPKKLEIFTRADIPSVKRQVVQVPLWGGKYAWGHEPTVAEKARAASTSQMGGRFDIGRWNLEIFVDCVKDGPGADAKPIFNRKDDWGWLENQGAAVVENVIQAVIALGVPDEKALDAMRDFFARMPGVLKNE